MSTLQPAPGRHTRRRVIIGVAIAVVVYTLVALLYSSSGRVDSAGGIQQPAAGEVTVVLTPQTVDAAGERISTQLRLIVSDQLLEPGSSTLADPLIVVVSPVDGSQTIDYAAGSIPGITTVSLFAPGAVENWPFDIYRSSLQLGVYVVKNGDAVALPSPYIIGAGYLPGWSLSAPKPTASDEGDAGIFDVQITAVRSWSTLAFGILLLGLMVLIAALVLYVSTTVYRGRRKVEASFMSWIGAMLFATIPLRGFLPGSPPVGSWIDFLVVLWVIVALVTGLGIYVTAWKRWGSPAERPPISPAAGGTPARAPEEQPDGQD
ncbi:DUF4436 family protein [Subtercola boreus]|uniref:DUF4436 family protein n=1 Tax=Subtercola boreus TaxID=120213 RepID=UPI00155963CA|nr:DUF4436 family protein [Subtercola boreus]